MIKRSDLLAMGYYKSAVFTGSDGPMRYRVERKKGSEEGAPDVFLATVWPGPYAFDATDPGQMTTAEEPFTEEGLCSIADRLNGFRETFEKAPGILDQEPFISKAEGEEE